MTSNSAGYDMADVKIDADVASKSSRSGAQTPVDGQDQNRRRKSTNPYRQYQDVPGTTFPRPLRSLSQDTEGSSGGNRKNAPPRAVFFDLPTAHSSITSGTARNKGRETPSSLHDNLDDENSFQLQELDPSTRPTDFIKNAPLPPLPAVLPKSRYGESPADYGFAGSDGSSPKERNRVISPTQPEPRSGPIAVLSSLKNVLVSLSSPLTPKDNSSALTPTQWPGYNSLGNRQGGNLQQEYNLEDEFEPVTRSPVSKNSSKQGSSEGYSGDLSSIYHSSLGGAPSGSLPSSSQKDDTGRNPGQGRTRAARRQAFGYYSSAPRFENLPSTPDDDDDVLPLPRRPREYGNQSNDGSSQPDGSTVGNIYKHYQGSVSGNDQSEYDLPRVDKGKQKQVFSSSVVTDNQLRPSALLVRKHNRDVKVSVTAQGQPPKFGLPEAPKPIPQQQQLLQSSSQGLPQSSSYGDTNQLLELSQREHWTGIRPAMSRSAGRSDLRSDIPSPPFGDSSSPTWPSSNPFRGNAGPQVVVSEATDDDFLANNGINYATADREPLEREVSNALRRASGMSAYSDDSISSPLRYTEYQSDLPSSESIGCLRRQSIADGESISGNGDDAAGRMQAFYNRGAIAPSWVNNYHSNAIRVPINPQGGILDLPPPSPPTQHTLPAPNQGQSAERVSDDINDWETVGESALGGYRSNGATDGMLGGTVHRAGSSIANTSDEGTGSSHIPDIEEYGSTERFVQHPGPIEYHNDYRLRDLKETRTPVFLPKFREHKINGYLADSNRTRPPVNLFSYNPRPLDDHMNPFQSPPPEHLPSQKVKASQQPRHYRAPSPMPFSMKTSNTTETVVTENSLANFTGPNRIIRRSQLNPNWMDDYGDPGPVISTPDVKQRAHNSYDHVMILAQGGTIEGYNPDGTPIEDPNDHIAVNDGNDGIVEAGSYRRVENPRDRTPLIKGPPGAFYRGLQQRTRSEAIRSTGQSKDAEDAFVPHPRKRSTKQLPTNQLRPLSLLYSAPITPEGNQLNKLVRRDDFLYRSPLGPPKRHSTHMLYKQSELDKFDDMAVTARRGLTLSSSKDSGFQRQLFEAPRLYANPADLEGGRRPGLCVRKRNVSVTVLLLCNFFPPLLGLYAVGRLDIIAEWWTNGEIMKFGKGQKRFAYYMATCWALAVFLGIVSFLIYVSGPIFIDRGCLAVLIPLL